ncbi:MAG: FUSC family protein, partial [Gemmataceae bacterium]
YLGVISVHMLLAAETPSVLQKGFERILGRCSGVLTGLILIVFFRERVILCLLLLTMCKLAFFYVYESGRLSYSGMQAGVFMVVIAGIGLKDPAGAPRAAVDIIAQILLGVAAAFAVSWLGKIEDRIHIDPSPPPLYPLRLDWLNHSARITSGMLATFFVTLYFDLPIIPAMVSAGIIGVAPGQRARLVKGAERTVGALVGTAYALPALVLIYYVQHFAVLLALVCFGMFLAAYLTRTVTAHSYVFLQMGLVIPMVLIGSGNVVGSVDTAVERLLGIWSAMITTLAVESLWPGEIDVPT